MRQSIAQERTSADVAVTREPIKGRLDSGAGAMRQNCEATTVKGTPCKAPAREHKKLCWFHDPSAERQRDDARQRGGRARWREYLARASQHETTATGVLLYLEDVMQALSTPGLDAIEINRLRASCYAASVALKAVEQADLAIRVQAVEETLADREVSR